MAVCSWFMSGLRKAKSECFELVLFVCLWVVVIC